MQNLVKRPRPPGTTVGATRCAQQAGYRGAAGEVSGASRPDSGEMDGQLAGRSRVIHMLWNGFLSVGVEPDDRPWSRRLMIGAAAG